MKVKVTVKELLEMTIKELEAINVPARYANDIARPIWQSIQNLRQCVEAFPEDKQPEEVKEDNV